MAELKTLCIDATCMSNTKYGAGDYMKLENDDFSLPIRYEWSNIETFTLTHNVLTNKSIFTVPERGWAIGQVMLQFSANVTGTRFSMVGKIDPNESIGILSYGSQLRTGAAPSGVTQHVLPFNRYVRKDEIIGIRMFQNSGTDLTISGGLISFSFIPYTSE